MPEIWVLNLLELWKDSKPNIFDSEVGLQRDQIPIREANKIDIWQFLNPFFDMSKFYDDNYLAHKIDLYYQQTIYLLAVTF